MRGRMIEGNTNHDKLYHSSLPLIVFILFFTGLYISLIFNKNIWTDEAFTMELVRENNFWGIVKGTANDVHPPLYYLIVKIFVLVFGDKFYIFKIVSVIPIVLTMLLAFFYVKPWWGTRAAVLYMIMLNAIPCVMEYGVQIRMYAWALFFVTWAGLNAYGICTQNQKEEDRQQDYIQLTVASICGCYTHTYAMISCVCIYFLVCIYTLCSGKGFRKQILFKRCILSGCVVAICYIPWLIVLFQQMINRIDNYWIEPVTGQVILQYVNFLFSSRIPYSEGMYFMLCMMAIVICMWRGSRKDKEGIGALMFLAVPILTAGIGIVLSILVTPFFIARYLLPCMGLLAVFFAVAFQRERSYVHILIGVFGMFMVINAYQTNFQAEYKSTQVDELLDFMEEHMGEDDLIAYNYEIYGFIYDIYFDDSKTVFLSDIDFAQNFENIWYFDSCVTPWLDSQVLTEYGLEKEFIMNTGIEQNAFHLYRIYHTGNH